MTQFPGFVYRDNRLLVEDVELQDIANAYCTPCYVYSLDAIRQSWLAYERAFRGLPFTLCYAVKANSNLSILRHLAGWGAGFDIVSVGELERVLLAGAEPDKIVFSGVAKRSDEIARALHAGVHCINLESQAELEMVAAVAAELRMPARVSVRVNPNVDAKTHPYISTGLKENKFGIDISAAPAIYRQVVTQEYLQPIGISCHIGSQITELAPFEQAARQVLDLVENLAASGIRLQHIDLGGGLGIQYRDEHIPEVSQFAACLTGLLDSASHPLMLEPGRSLVGNAGVLLTRVEYIKKTPAKSFALIDAGMNDLMRPSLYQAWHEILPVQTRPDAGWVIYDVVGPVCESGDFIATGRELPELHRGDVIAVMSAGAYGMAMASNYNSRVLPAEVLVSGSKIDLIRRRQPLEQMWANELLEN